MVSVEAASAIAGQRKSSKLVPSCEKKNKLVFYVVYAILSSRYHIGITSPKHTAIFDVSCSAFKECLFQCYFALTNACSAFAYLTEKHSIHVTSTSRHYCQPGFWTRHPSSRCPGYGL